MHRSLSTRSIMAELEQVNLQSRKKENVAPEPLKLKKFEDPNRKERRGKKKREGEDKEKENRERKVQVVPHRHWLSKGEELGLLA